MIIRYLDPWGKALCAALASLQGSRSSSGLGSAVYVHWSFWFHRAFVEFWDYSGFVVMA